MRCNPPFFGRPRPGTLSAALPQKSAPPSLPSQCQAQRAELQGVVDQLTSELRAAEGAASQAQAAAASNASEDGAFSFEMKDGILRVGWSHGVLYLFVFLGL